MFLYISFIRGKNDEKILVDGGIGFGDGFPGDGGY